VPGLRWEGSSAQTRCKDPPYHTMVALVLIEAPSADRVVITAVAAQSKAVHSKPGFGQRRLSGEERKPPYPNMGFQTDCPTGIAGNTDSY
jgi:hypothetical protein